MKFDIKEIEQHQKSYDEKLNEYREKMSSRVTDIHHRSRSYGDNQFRSLVLTNIEQEKLEEYHRLNHGHDMKEKICKYLEEVKEKHRPKISQKSRFELPKSKARSNHALSSKEQRVQGLEYLEKSKKLKDYEK